MSARGEQSLACTRLEGFVVKDLVPSVVFFVCCGCAFVFTSGSVTSVGTIVDVYGHSD